MINESDTFLCLKKSKSVAVLCGNCEVVKPYVSVVLYSPV